MVAMSGGVDSSVTAFLVLQQGFSALGATMRLINNYDPSPDKARACGAETDIADAKAVCARLGCPHEVLDFAEPFRHEVMERFAKAYEAGLTPNPCVDCNRYIKFGRLFQAARSENCDYIATGHYARVTKQGDRRVLQKAVDESKDQSYVLYSLSAEQLRHTMFPLGEFTKAEVRELAEENGFANAKKRDSQDICFVPDGDYAAFLERFTGKTFAPGDFVDRTGRVLGTHKGIIRYTIGQRRGLGLALPASMYVLEKDVPNNRVVLGFDDDLYTKKLTVGDLCLSACDTLSGEEKLCVKIRYNQKAQPATVVQTEKDRLEITFDEPQRAVTRGQAAVLYDGETVVGGGTIL